MTFETTEEQTDDVFGPGIQLLNHGERFSLY
jgi:hypothetical protein